MKPKKIYLIVSRTFTEQGMGGYYEYSNDVAFLDLDKAEQRRDELESEGYLRTEWGIQTIRIEDSN